MIMWKVLMKKKIFNGWYTEESRREFNGGTGGKGEIVVMKVDWWWTM